MSVGTYDVVDTIGVIEIDSPPVNALGIAVRRALDEGLTRFAADDAVRGIVLICAERTFFAGADITEFGRAPQSPGLHDIIDAIENSPKPIVAAIHGTALGGGLELALACHYRIAVNTARLGLPEVALGLLPGAGGTQRLPRLVGVEMALDLMTSGRQIEADEALRLGVIDLMAANDLRHDAIAFARQLLDQGRPLQRVRDRQDRIDPARGDATLFAEFRARHARALRGFKAPENIIKAVEAAVALPFDEGLARERELFLELIGSIESAAQRHYFFAERQTARVPDVPTETPTRPIRTVGVIGAGTMGGGIAMNFLNAGIPVTLVDREQAALDRGVTVIRRNYEASAAKGRLSAQEMQARLALLSSTLDMNALADVDLVIEAVFEEIGLKQAIFAELGGIVRVDTILASNTSFLDLDAIAAATTGAERVIGLHFFSPANVMKLLEVVRGAATSAETIATAMKLAKTIGKVAVLSRVCPGFIANRIMAQRGRQATALVLEGPTPQEIDDAVYGYGFAMGPFRMNDLVGLDVIGRGGTERTINGDLVALGRRGQKGGGGYYDYDEARNATPSPVAAQVIADLATAKGITPSGSLLPEGILARLLYPVVNEGTKLLDEGIALRASDIDVAAILGYGWPVHTGGPMFWADTIGLPRIVAALKDLQAQHGDAFAPSPLLERKAAEGGRLSG